jgi:hypothetical protein
MTGFADPAGRPVRAGDTVRLTATYDNARPHVRVMGIMIMYLAPGPASSCAAYSSTLPAPSTAEQVSIELLKRPAGPLQRYIRSTWVGDYAFGAQRVSLRRGRASPGASAEESSTTSLWRPARPGSRLRA